MVVKYGFWRQKCVEREKQRAACVLISQEGLRGDPVGGRGAKNPSILITLRHLGSLSYHQHLDLHSHSHGWPSHDENAKMGAREEGYPSISIRTPTDKLGSDLRKRNEIRFRILMFWWMHKILSQIESILKHLNIPKYILLVQDLALCTLLVLDCREMCKTNIISTKKIGAPFKRALLV